MHRPHRTTTPGVVDRTDRPTRPAPATSPTLGIAALTGFCVIMAGPNVPIPLLPVYVEQFTLDPLDQAVLYSSWDCPDFP